MCRSRIKRWFAVGLQALTHYHGTLCLNLGQSAQGRDAQTSFSAGGVRAFGRDTLTKEDNLRRHLRILREVGPDAWRRIDMIAFACDGESATSAISLVAVRLSSRVRSQKQSQRKVFGKRWMKSSRKRRPTEINGFQTVADEALFLGILMRYISNVIKAGSETPSFELCVAKPSQNTGI